MLVHIILVLVSRLPLILDQILISYKYVFKGRNCVRCREIIQPLKINGNRVPKAISAKSLQYTVLILFNAKPPRDYHQQHVRPQFAISSYLMIIVALKKYKFMKKRFYSLSNALTMHINNFNHKFNLKILTSIRCIENIRFSAISTVNIRLVSPLSTQISNQYGKFEHLFALGKKKKKTPKECVNLENQISVRY